MSKRIDFTQLGGFPLTQNRLDYMQQAYDEIMKALVLQGGDDGSVPIIVSGMQLTSAGGYSTITNGWFFRSGKLIAFTGNTLAIAGGNVEMVQITATATPLTYNNGSTPNVILDSTAAFLAGPAITNAFNFPYSTMKRWGIETAWSSLAVSTPSGYGGVTGTIYYKKNFINNTVLIRATLTAANADHFLTISMAQYMQMAQFPAGYIPANDVYLTAHIRDIQDDEASQHIEQLSCKIVNAGAGINAGMITIRWIRAVAPSAYIIDLSGIIPLD